MSWEDEIKELRQREQLALKMGGQDKVARQHEFGKLTIRERIAAICDPDSFQMVFKVMSVAGHSIKLQYTCYYDKFTLLYASQPCSTRNNLPW